MWRRNLFQRATRTCTRFSADSTRGVMRDTPSSPNSTTEASPRGARGARSDVRGGRPRGTDRGGSVSLNPVESARAARLRYVSDGIPGIRRVRSGRSFQYLAPDGAVIRAPGQLHRIRSLVIPPAWVDVWICPIPEGHLQATGRDARGRKQYRYHPRWKEVRDETKYGKMIAFGQALPLIRSRMDRDLSRRELSRSKVLAVHRRIIGPHAGAAPGAAERPRPAPLRGAAHPRVSLQCVQEIVGPTAPSGTGDRSKVAPIALITTTGAGSPDSIWRAQARRATIRNRAEPRPNIPE